jgi:phage antirepressor YoqD-like protein
MNMREVNTFSEIFLDMSEVANICQIKIKGKLVGRNELFKLLRKNRVLQEGNNLPYRKYIDLDYFRVKRTQIEKPNQYTKETFKTTVSQKGIEFIKELLIQK